MNVYQWRYNLFPNDLMHKKGKKMKIKYSKSNVWVKTIPISHEETENSRINFTRAFTQSRG